MTRRPASEPALQSRRQRAGRKACGERQDGYWGAAERGHADQIEITVINDATARTASLQAGGVHIINRIEPKIVALVKRIPGVTIRNVPGKGHYVLIAHCNTAPFDNNDLRLALKYAVDREEMVAKILAGYGTVGNDTPMIKGYPLFDDDIEQRVFDPDKAKFHFKKSGHDGSILLRTSTSPSQGQSTPRSFSRQAPQSAASTSS